jgi:hypothetical protein
MEAAGIVGEWASVAVVLRAIALLLLGRVIMFLHEGYQIRMKFRAMKAQGIVSDVFILF